MDWEKYGFVVASDYRKRVVLSLFECPKTPKMISKETGLYISHVSKTLFELMTEGIVVCLAPGLKRGRVYGLTDLGNEIYKYLKKRQS
jgi:predicted transcriptional regulator